MGPLQDKEIISSLLEKLPSMQFGTAKQMDKLLSQLLREPDTCSFYDYHVVSRNLRVSPPAMDEMLDGLNDLGYYTVRTHFSVTGIKTTAPLHVIEAWILAWNKERNL